MDLPDLIQRLICDISGWTMPMGQAASAAGNLFAIMERLGEAFGRAASMSGQTTQAVNQQTQAVNNLGNAANQTAAAVSRMVQAFGAGGTLAAPSPVSSSGGGGREDPKAAAANFSRNWINAVQEVTTAGQAGAARFSRNWINAAEDMKKATERGATPAEFARVFGRLPADSTFVKDQATNEAFQKHLQQQFKAQAASAAGDPGWNRFVQSSVQAGLRADQQQLQARLKEQVQAAKEAARATEHAMMQIKHSWMQFGRDLMSLTGHITHGMAAFVEQNVPLVGGILAGAKRGSLMGWSVGGSMGSALGGTLGLGLGGPGGAIAGSMIGNVVGVGLGSISGAMIGGNVAAMVESITLAVNGLEKAFDMVAGAAKNAFQAVVSLASEFQRISVAFEVFTGSADKGNKLFADMQQLAVQTPYNLRQMVDISQTLLAMGVPFEDVTNSMRMLGDVAAGDVDRLRRLTLAFSEVVAEGKLTGQRMRQFAAAGVGAADIAQTMGISIPALREQMREGSIPAQAVIDTFERITSAGGRFFMMSERQARTVAGAWSNLIDKLEIMGAKFGQVAFQRFDVAGMIGRAGDFIGENAPAVLERLISLLSAVKAAFTGMLEAVIPYWNQLIAVVENLIGKINMTPLGLERIQSAFRTMTSNVIQFLGSVLVLLAELAKKAIGFLPGVSNNLQQAIEFSRAPLSTTAKGLVAASAVGPLSMFGGPASSILGLLGSGSDGGGGTVAAPITDVFDNAAKAIEKSINGFIAIIEKMTGAAGQGTPLSGIEASIELEPGPLASFVNLLTNQKDWAINIDEMVKQMTPRSFIPGQVAGELGGVGVKESLERKALSDPQGFLDQYRGVFPGAANFPIMARGARATPSQLAGGALSSLIRYMASGAEDTALVQTPSWNQRLISGIGGMNAAGWISQVDSWLQKKLLVVTVSEEAKKLVDDLGKSLREGLTPLDQFAKNIKLIKEAFGPMQEEKMPDFVGPPARELALNMQALEFQRLLKGFGQDVPSPTAKMFGSKEAGDAIADAQNRGVKNLEAKLEEANQQREEANGELKEIRQILDRRERAGQPLIPGNIDN